MLDVRQCSINLNYWWSIAHLGNFPRFGIKASRVLHPIFDRGTFRQIFAQDIRAVQEEQRAYNLQGQDLSRETNPVSHAVRKVIFKTYGQPPLTQEPAIYKGKPL
jgi:hypothetical protein